MTLEEIIQSKPVEDLRRDHALLLRDWAATDLAIRERVKGILTDFEINGDTFGVPTIEDIVDRLCERIEAHGPKRTDPAPAQ